MAKENLKSVSVSNNERFIVEKASLKDGIVTTTGRNLSTGVLRSFISGVASTIHSTQGQTISEPLTLHETERMNQNLLNVAITRSRDISTLFIDKPCEDRKVDKLSERKLWIPWNTGLTAFKCTPPKIKGSVLSEDIEKHIRPQKNIHIKNGKVRVRLKTDSVNIDTDVSISKHGEEKAIQIAKNIVGSVTGRGGKLQLKPPEVVKNKMWTIAKWYEWDDALHTKMKTHTKKFKNLKTATGYSNKRAIQRAEEHIRSLMNSVEAC